MTRNGGADALTATFDAADQLRGLFRAGSPIASFEYDATGGLVSRRNGDRDLTTYTYGRRRPSRRRAHERSRGGLRVRLRRCSHSRDADRWRRPARTLRYTLDTAGPLSQVLAASDGNAKNDTGVFLTRDPFSGTRSDPHTLVPYTYAQNAPTSRVDPTGRSTLSLFRQMPRLSFTTIADPCTGTMLLFPDFSGPLAEAIFGSDYRAPSLTDLGLIPTLACNNTVQTKPVDPGAATYPCASSGAGFFQPGKIVVGPGGVLSASPVGRNAAQCRGPAPSGDGTFYDKATGGSSGGGSSASKKASTFGSTQWQCAFPSRSSTAGIADDHDLRIARGRPLSHAGNEGALARRGIRTPPIAR